MKTHIALFVASMAAFSIHAAKLTINGTEYTQGSGNGWELDGSTVRLLGGGPFVLSTGGVVVSNSIAFVTCKDCSVTFSNLAIASAKSNLLYTPFTVAPGTKTTLTLVGTNGLYACGNSPAISVVSNATGAALITIDAADTNQMLTVVGDLKGAGIGGVENRDCGVVTISGGTVTATGGYYGAGIGGGWGRSGGHVIISGGCVTATGGSTGAGIGGGYYSRGARVTISGGTVTATGGDYSAGIGGGNCGSSATVTITDGIVTANGGLDGAGIGGGGFKQSSGNSNIGGTVTISGGNVTAIGGQDGCGIGGGYGNIAWKVNISDGEVTATGGKDAAGIGWGYTSSDPYKYREGRVDISGGTVTANGVRIIKGTFTISGGTLTVSGRSSLIYGDAKVVPESDPIIVAAGANADAITYAESFSSEVDLTDTFTSYDYIQTHVAGVYQGGDIIDSTTLTDGMASWLEAKMIASGMSKDEYTAAIAAETDALSLDEEYLLNTDPAAATTVEFKILSIAIGDNVDVQVALVRTEGGLVVSNAINGTLKLYGATSPGGPYAVDQSLTEKFSGATTATTSASSSCRFIKAVIE